MQLQNAKAEMNRCQKEFDVTYKNIEKIFLDRLNGSLMKRGYSTISSFENATIIKKEIKVKNENSTQKVENEEGLPKLNGIEQLNTYLPQSTNNNITNAETGIYFQKYQVTNIKPTRLYNNYFISIIINYYLY
ncbi:Hypothetical_protein [Hexamita inflata]|uniref:Hypothetical_protein n=1 Tax=Hexamita inflata TaxID=28002 RepID=A0AA86PD29_9EUKA|nr:Hypothetical protein HINF_LOCUS24350 [Hexamita inflata]CAI9952494.1 Hypothetical protein HINF_LOCUS40139 [Hexamita inflata]